MKIKNYFHYIKKRLDKPKIKDAWIKNTIDNPAKTEIQSFLYVMKIILNFHKEL
jgi:hypothetical protein